MFSFLPKESLSPKKPGVERNLCPAQLQPLLAPRHAGGLQGGTCFQPVSGERFNANSSFPLGIGVRAWQRVIRLAL